MLPPSLIAFLTLEFSLALLLQSVLDEGLMDPKVLVLRKNKFRHLASSCSQKTTLKRDPVGSTVRYEVKKYGKPLCEMCWLSLIHN